MTDSTDIRILCLLLSAANNPMGSLFSIRLPSQSCVVEKLRESVKHKRPNALDSVDAADLEVWKPRTPDKKLDLNSGEPLTKKIREVFPAEYQPIDDPDMAIHPSDGIYMIRCPERHHRFARSGHVDPIAALQAEFETLELLKDRSPSSLTQAKSFKIVAGTEGAIGCNRPFKADTVPIALLDEVFLEFKEIQSGSVGPPSTRAYRLLDQLAEAACGWYSDEKKRAPIIGEILSDVAGIALKPGVVDGTIFQTDGHLQHSIMPAIIRECKNDSRNAAWQAMSYYGHFLRFAYQTYGTYGTRFPAILLIDMGQYIGFYGCVWNGKRIMVEPLSPLFDLSTPVREEAARKNIAYTFDALMVTYKRIEDHYSAIKIKGPLSSSMDRRHPQRTSYTDERDGMSKTFVYERRLLTKLVFLAYDDRDGSLLCIKFTRTYGADVHRFLAARGFAPWLRQIIYIGGGWNMVVMDRSSSRYKPLSQSVLDSESKARVRLMAMDIATLLSSRGFVHGDLRDTNILLNSEALEQGRVKLHVIDYDWAGPVGEVKYPDRVNTEDIKRPMGVKSGAVIEVEHDKEMISLLF